MADDKGDQGPFAERKASDRRGEDRREHPAPFDHADRRTGERRSGRDRRDS
jgi:hypothetical protein